ncbi:MAG TPA: alkaline phosphatase family protein [Acidimicrobiales bacterium]|nr:alkaline phosphatase family protein [Acidimicrobiales bacterium]
MERNVLFVTVDQWRGDCLSALGHDLVRTPNLDALAESGVLFANHWANAAPCGPSRACLYTGMYMQNHRSVMNGTPLDDRFTNVAREARRAGYKPALFGYTDTSVDPRTVPEGDPRTMSYEGVLPGFDAVVCDSWEHQGGTEWGKWLAERGIDVPAGPYELYGPDTSYPGADDHGPTWAPTLFPAELSETAFMTDKVIEWLERHAGEPFFAHVSYIRPHPPRRNPAGFHDLYDADAVGPFSGFARAEDEAAFHPLNRALLLNPATAAPRDERDRRQLRATYYGAQAEVDGQLGRLWGYLAEAGLAASTLVVLTSDHGEMGGDHWLVEKCGYWDESFRVPLIVRDPSASANATRGLVVRAPTESVDVMPTILDWLALEVPRQVDGWPLTPFLHDGEAPEHWRTGAHWEWDMRHAQLRVAETYFGIPGEHCSLAVLRTEQAKYVQFAAAADVLPPLLFDLRADPGHTHRAVDDRLELEMAQEMLRWRARNLDRSLSNCYLAPGVGPVWAKDPWR